MDDLNRQSYEYKSCGDCLIRRTLSYLFRSYADVAFIPIVMYPLARLTLLILALLSLRNLSDSALQTVHLTCPDKPT